MPLCIFKKYGKVGRFHLEENVKKEEQGKTKRKFMLKG
jgi:hypothetical protein